MARILFWLILFFIVPFSVFPEGSKQLLPNPDGKGELCIDRSRNQFGFYDSPPEFRLNIFISDVNEKIYFGLGSLTQPDSVKPVEYRIKDPNGNIVFGPKQIPDTTKPGFISSLDEAIAGPFPLAGGYTPLVVQPLMTGNYYIEFYYAPDIPPSTWLEFESIQFRFFDISVISPSGTRIDGRVWSKAWQLNCGNVESPPTKHRFWGTMFIYSDDSIVTSANCNGFVGGTFTISSNPTGCSSTGNLTNDRRSRTGFHTYPQYKIFLTDPDSIAFPTGTLNAGIVPPILVTQTCSSGKVDFGVMVTRNGVIELLIEENMTPGADPEDTKLTANVLANPGGNGYNMITWNGFSGQGFPIPNGTPLRVTVKFIYGMSHIPLYDIEYNDNGFLVQVVRPKQATPLIYWDDSDMPDGLGTVNTNGCIQSNGCHMWEMNLGDTNTINSWWYLESNTLPVIVNLTKKTTPRSPGAISGNPSICEQIHSETYSVQLEPSSIGYTWNYSGTGVVLHSNGNSVTIDFLAGATSGILSVNGYNTECGDGDASQLQLTMFPLPVVRLDSLPPACEHFPPFNLYGGTPAGGSYEIEGIPVTVLNPASLGLGNYSVSYFYTDSNGCSGSDSTMIKIINGGECDVLIVFPNAFTPNDDGLNDFFRPKSLNIRTYLLQIFDRWGQLLYTSNDISEGWNGKFSGYFCMPDEYLYIATYENPLSPSEKKVIKGSFSLLR